MSDAVALLPGTVEQLIARTLRVPTFVGPAGNGEVVARQLDAALLSEGFAAPTDLLAHVAGLEPGVAFDAAVLIVGAAKRRIGSHVEANPYFVDFPHADVTRRRERWKRLGERLHPHEHAARWPNAARVFAVARGEEVVRSATGRAELAAGRGDVAGAARALAPTPGVLLRWADRLLRSAVAAERSPVLDELGRALPSASGRVLCSLRSHLDNADRPNRERLFVTRRGRAHLEPETRPALVGAHRLAALVDDEIARRLPPPGTLVIDPAVLDVALPLSGKASGDGHAVLPRGTTAALPAGADVLRFFVHWRQAARRTDFDLSLLLLDGGFHAVGQVSWTNLRSSGVVHSGDVTDATEGATEFIDVPLDTVDARHVVPQVNIYAGEGFDEVAESWFGYLTLERSRWSRRTPPFDPRAVRARSELRGTGRVALPLAFSRHDDGWRATWTHVQLSGRPSVNQVEGSFVTTSSLVRDAVTRRVLTVRHLVDLWAWQADRVIVLPAGDLSELAGPVTYLGLEPMAGLPASAESITVARLNALIPE